MAPIDADRARLRQLVIEELAHRKLAPLPKTIADENRWFTQLMADRAFRAIYDHIDWTSPEAHAAYALALAHDTAELGEHHKPALAAPTSCTPRS